ncbi:divergent polysaccharide deacetylase family protein [Pseudooceanicola sp.]|uniref:divergent polysaccharide deacetylase family protein n=1 Tax=Pseudooceanicola sp. TaxID=1914328 RepID=UPI004058BAA6
MLRGILTGSLWGLVLGGGLMAVASLTFPMGEDAPLAGETPNVPSESAFGAPRSDLPVRIPSQMPAPERTKAPRASQPEGDTLAAIDTRELQTAEAPQMDLRGATLATDPKTTEAAVARPAREQPVLPNPLARPPGAPQPDAELVVTTEPSTPPRARPGAVKTYFPTGDLSEAVQGPAPLAEAAPEGSVAGEAEGVTMAEVAQPDEAEVEEGARSEVADDEGVQIVIAEADSVEFDSEDGLSPDDRGAATDDDVTPLALARAPSPNRDETPATNRRPEATAPPEKAIIPTRPGVRDDPTIAATIDEPTPTIVEDPATVTAADGSSPGPISEDLAADGPAAPPAGTRDPEADQLAGNLAATPRETDPSTAPELRADTREDQTLPVPTADASEEPAQPSPTTEARRRQELTAMDALPGDTQNVPAEVTTTSSNPVARITPSPETRPAMPGQPARRLTERTSDTTPNTDETQNSANDTLPETPTSEPEDIRPPIERFAVPFENPEGKPILAIVLIDDGAGATDLPPNFPYPLSVAVAANAPDAAARMRRYRAEGLEVLALADLPANPGPADVTAAAPEWFDALPEAVAVMETPARNLQTGRATSEALAATLAETGHGLLLYPEGLDTARKLATRRGVPAASVFRDLDGEGQDASVVRRFLDHSAFKAGQEGAVILVARLRPETVQALLVWGLADRASRVALAPASYALKAAAP